LAAASSRAKVEAVLRDNPDITVLVNNAGVGSVASILQADVDKMEAMIDLTEDCVDAALAGLDAGELVTIPGLHEQELWTRWEAERREISPKFRNGKPAPRYGIGSRTTSVA
jgi:short-subunit dehydrogenase